MTEFKNSLVSIQYASYIRLSFVPSPNISQGDLDSIIKFRLDGRQYEELDHFYDVNANLYEVYLKFPSISSARSGIASLKVDDIEGCTFEAWLEDANCLSNRKIAEQVQQELEECRQQILIHKDLLLDAHAEKTLSLKNDLKSRLAQKYDKDTLDTGIGEIKTLEERLTHLCMEKEEFVQVCQKMDEILGKLGQPVSFQGFRSNLNKVKRIYQLESNFFATGLPIYGFRTKVVDTVFENKASVILADTGSGKSTQIVQYLYQANLCEKGMIICTQPRKVAAVSLARHVSQQMGSSVGQIVGYEVGLSCKKSDLTKILYMTDSQFLNVCLKNPLLEGIAVVIIDEAHERSLNSDFIISIVKKVACQRDDFRTVVTSATMDPEKFITYFDSCPLIQVPGRIFPVEVIYTEDELDAKGNFLEKTLKIVQEIHQTQPPGDILVFVTTPQDVENGCKILREAAFDDNLYSLPLHGRLQVEEQQKVFVDTAKGKRKVVYATNAAETSITIPGIKYVIDTGLAKEKYYDPKRNVSKLVVGPICKSSADQRKGRAGRTGPGICYRMYSESDYDCMEKMTKPEILRCHLGQAILKLMELGVTDPSEFEFVESPDKEAIKKAIDLLRYLGAMDDMGITDFGLHMAKFPLEPRLSKMILCSIQQDIPLEGIVVAAMMAHSSGIFLRCGTVEEIELADKCKLQFCQPYGDMVSFLALYSQWNSIEEKKKMEWCKENFISSRCMRAVRDLVKEIMDILARSLNVLIKYELPDQEKVIMGLQLVVAQCFGRNIAVFSGNPLLGYIALDVCQQVRIHPSSALRYLYNNYNPTFVLYDQLLTTSDDYIITIMPLEDAFLQQLVELGFIDAEVLQKDEWDFHACLSLGPLILKKFIGLLGSNIRRMQEELRSLLNTPSACIRASVFTGELIVCYLRNDASRAKEFVEDKILNYIKEEKEVLVSDVIEIPVVDNLFSNPTLILIGKGGEIEDILLPEEYRFVRVHGVPYDFTTDHVKECFKEFGNVNRVLKLKRKEEIAHLGETFLVFFRKAKEAVAAVEKNRRMKKSRDHDARKEDCDFLEIVDVVPGRKVFGKRQNKPFTKISIKWLRRQNRGFGFIQFNDDLACRTATDILVGKTLHFTDVSYDCCIHQKCATFNCGKKYGQIFIKNIPTFIDNDKLQKCVEAMLPSDIKPPMIRTPLEKPFTSDLNFLGMIKDYFKELLTRKLPDSKLKLDFKELYEKTVHYAMDIYCDTSQEAQVIIEFFSTLTTWRAPTAIGNVTAHAHFNVDCSSTFEIHCTAKIFMVMQKRLEQMQQNLNRNCAKGVKFVIDDKSFPGRVVLSVESKDSAQSYNAVSMLNKLLSGTVMSCERHGNEPLRSLFTYAGRKKLDLIAEATDCHITSNQFAYTITIYGEDNQVTDAIERIQRYKQELLDNSEVVELSLFPPDYPVGTAKQLVVDYGATLTSLIDETDVAQVSLNVSNQALGLVGSTRAITKVKEIIADCAKKVEGCASTISYAEILDLPCILCQTPIERPMVYRLEYCGHAYHRDCIMPMVTMDDPVIPLVCYQQDCQKPLVAADLKQLIGDPTQANNIKTVALRQFMAASEEYIYCPGPACCSFLRVDPESSRALCSGCGNIVCTTCKCLYHLGVTCDLYRLLNDKENTEFKVWVSEDPENRKICPRCCNGIEKTGGCNHVHCIVCKSHVCWICLQLFTSSDDCYRHVREKHNTL